MNGECTEDELLAKFLQNFESSGIENAEVRKNKKSNISFNIKKEYKVKWTIKYKNKSGEKMLKIIKMNKKKLQKKK